MIYNKNYDFYCYRTNVSDQTAGVRISPRFIDTSLSQDIAATGTTANGRSPAIHKKKQNIFCTCKAKTWNSIVDLYNKKNTTVVWDNGDPVSNKPVEIKRHFRFNKNKGSYMVTTKGKSRNTKDEKNKYRINNIVGSKDKKSRKRKINGTQNLIEDPKKAEYTKICQEGVCKTNKEKGKKHHCKCNKNKERRRRTTTCTDNSCNTYRIGNITKSCIDFFCSLLKKQKSEKWNKTEVTKPVFSIRVDSSSLNVLNPNEIKTKVKIFGTVGKNDKCICPSRLEKEKKYGIGKTCEGGVCDAARRGKYDKFNCRCEKTALIECCDTTCDNIEPTKGKLEKIANLVRNSHLKNITPRKSNKPLFEMVLDNNHMNVLNTGEIYDVLRKASHSDMCPTGICRATANKDRILNCKCLSKKIAPILHECNKKTCKGGTVEPKKKSKFYICTRICSSLQNWTCRKNQGDLINQENDILDQKLSIKKGKPVQLAKPADRVKTAKVKQWKYVQDVGDTKIRITKNQRQLMRLKDSEPISGRNPKESKKVRKKRNLKKNGSFGNKAMAKKMRETEKQISKASLKREKLYNKKQKQMDQEVRKRKKKIAKMHSREEHQLNFLAAFVIGTVNLSLQVFRGIITAVISIIADPIHSYIYVKHRIKDPVGTCKMFKHWFTNTWTARDTKISSLVQESTVIDILSDQLENSTLFEMFANKGQTQEERQMYERKKKRRQKRIRKRHDQALYSCRHTLLMTLRKHPCIWVYHICPFFYPQFLALTAFLKNFFHILLYLAALMCWTPCIMCMELVRALFCCIACAQ